MFTRWDRTDRGGLVSALEMMDELRREMDRVFDGYERSMGIAPFGTLGRGMGGWPEVALSDEGERFVLRADMPGVTEQDLEVTFDRGAVTLRARREASVPEGFTVHRKERSSFELARTVALPAAIDVDRAEATLRHGALEISLPKAKEAQPRRLAIRSGDTN